MSGSSSIQVASRIALLTIAAAAASCTVGAPTEGGLEAQLSRDWTYWMTQYPEAATQVGFPGQDARWTDYSASAIAAREAYLRDSFQQLQKVDRAALTVEDQLNYDLYRQIVEAAVQGLEFHNDAVPMRGVIPHNLLMPINQLEGIQQDIPRTIAAMPASSVEQYEHIVTRLEQVPPLIEQTIRLLQQGVTAGQTPPRITLRDVPGQVSAQIVSDPMQSPLLRAFSNWPASIAAADRERLTAQAVAAYKTRVLPAMTQLMQYLADTYLPACRETTAAGALANGAAMYAYNVRWHTTTALTPQQIHDIGQGEVKRIRAEMEKVIADAGYAGRFDAFVKFLRTDKQFFYTDEASLLSGYRDVAKRADPELARLFGRLPQNTYGVIAVPAAVAPSQTTAYYDPGSLKVGRPGYMNANTYKLDARPKWEMEALTMHEAVPGHHLQISIAQEIEGLPDFRKNSSYTAFVEGWGLYAERLGEEMGFYRTPYAKFGQLTYEMWRAVRLVVDTGLHSMNWTRQQAIEFFLANTAKTEQDITVEVDRYIVWPGQALGYKMGQLKISELRAKAEQALGPRFDIRAFHDTVLGAGAVPLDVLTQRVDAWIAATKKS